MGRLFLKAIHDGLFTGNDSSHIQGLYASAEHHFPEHIQNARFITADGSKTVAWRGKYLDLDDTRAYAARVQGMIMNSVSYERMTE